MKSFLRFLMDLPNNDLYILIFTVVEWPLNTFKSTLVSIIVKWRWSVRTTNSTFKKNLKWMGKN